MNRRAGEDLAGQVAGRDAAGDDPAPQEHVGPVAGVLLTDDQGSSFGVAVDVDRLGRKDLAVLVQIDVVADPEQHVSEAGDDRAVRDGEQVVLGTLEVAVLE